MSRSIRNFYPTENKTITWAAASNSQNVGFATAFPNSDPAKIPSALEIANRTSVDVFVAWGTDNTVAAAVATGYQVGPGVDKIIDIGAGNTWVAIIPSGSVTGSVYLSRGLGS